MSGKPEQGRLLTLIYYQRYLGLTDIEYNSIDNCYVINGNWWTFGMQVLMLAILIIGTCCTWNANGYLYMDMRSRAGNVFYYLVVLATPILQLLVQVWLRCQQDSQCDLLKMLNDLSSRLNVDTVKLSLPRWLCRLWIAINFYYVGTSICFSKCHYFTFGYLIAIVGFHVHIIRTNYIITLYTSLVYGTLVLLKEQASQLHIIESGILISMEQLASNLCIHDELLLLCHEQMVEVFGGTFVFIVFYFLLDSTCICYMSTLEELLAGTEVGFLLNWFLPLCLYFSLPLLINNLATQVSDMS